jgi:hypothetical protein
MVSSGMLRRVALVRTDVSEDLSASIIRETEMFSGQTNEQFLYKTLRIIIASSLVYIL